MDFNVFSLFNWMFLVLGILFLLGALIAFIAIVIRGVVGKNVSAALWCVLIVGLVLGMLFLYLVIQP